VATKRKRTERTRAKQSTAPSKRATRVATQEDARTERERLFAMLSETEGEWGKLARTELGNAEARHVHSVLRAVLVAAGRLFIFDRLPAVHSGEANPDWRRVARTNRKQRAEQWLAKAATTARPILGEPAPARAAKARINFLRNVIGARPEGDHQNALSLVTFITFGGNALRRDAPKLRGPETVIGETSINGTPTGVTALWPVSGPLDEPLAAVERAFAERVSRDDWSTLRPHRKADALILVGLMALGCAEMRARNLLRVPL
jgi:hypothetical protein